MFKLTFVVFFLLFLGTFPKTKWRFANAQFTQKSNYPEIIQPEPNQPYKNKDNKLLFDINKTNHLNVTLRLGVGWRTSSPVVTSLFMFWNPSILLAPSSSPLIPQNIFQSWSFETTPSHPTPKKWIWPNKCTFLTWGRPDSVDWIKKLSILSDALSHPSDFARARQPLTWISRPEFAGALERGPAVAPGVFAGKKASGFFGFCKNCFIHRGSTLS